MTRVGRRLGWTSAAGLLIVASACAGSPSNESLALTKPLSARLEAILDGSVADGGLPGVQAAVVFPDGTVWTGEAGVASHESGEDVTAETRFPIGSITKLFTATALLRLADRGELSLDDKATEWVPDEPVDARVTLRQLLRHTGGLPGRVESTCEPGTCVNYSNDGYRLLGRVIEAVTGDSLARAYHDEILDRSGLAATVLGTQEVVDGPVATGHDPDGLLEPADVTVRWTEADGDITIGSSGAIVSTARDVAVFAAALFRGELIEPRTKREMLDFDMSSGLAGFDECGAYGLGVLRSSAGTEFGLAWGHDGIVDGFTAAARYYPGYDIAIAVLVNASRIGGGAPSVEELLASELLEGRSPIDADRSRGRCVQDVYTIRPDGSDVSNVTDDDRLEWSVTWSPDGRRLMFAATVDGDDDVYVIDVDGSGLERVTDTPGIDGAASWSPDGERIVFESERSGGRRLHAAAADGTGAEVLGEGRLPAWSPRGDTIAYSAPGPSGDLGLWLVDDDGTNPRQLSAGVGNELWASWSPDGSAIAFTVDGTLATIDVDTAMITPIDIDREAVGAASVEFAAWGPAGRIAFVEGSDIWTVRPDGSDPVEVGGSRGRDFTPAWSPDGELIAFIGSRWQQ